MLHYYVRVLLVLRHGQECGPVVGLGLPTRARACLAG